MKKSKLIKAIIASLAVAATVACSALMGGCIGSTPKDGANGKDLNIYDLYEAAKAESGKSDMTMEEFLKEYLSFTSSDLQQATTLKAAINRSLLSAVSVNARFRTGVLTEKVGAGSGVIVDIDREKGDMTVLTNCHVVYNADAAAENRNQGFSTGISVWLYGYESSTVAVNGANAINAELIAASKSYDVALLKVTGSDIVKNSKAVKADWSKCEDVYPGETVYTIGNSQSYHLSANVGYIAKAFENVKTNIGTDDHPDAREFEVIRTNAPIYPGNSGGGLFDINGELVGLVNSASIAQDDKPSLSGMGYALTGSAVRRVVDRMLKDYTDTAKYGVRRVNHGVSTYVSDAYCTGLNDKGFAELREQVTVSSVSFGTNAYNKIKSGDVIESVKIIRGTTVIENVEIKREHNFHDVMLAADAGDTVKVTVTRGGNKEEVSFTVTRFETAV
ncbi:MAG: S1C family serine protease [Clostridia bacterium]|nr:S1C family serine protease [Clostridia bacterium]